MTTNQFFDESSEQSQVKSEIVSKYFWTWAKIMLSKVNKIGYIDLFAGPGRYKDGTKSTPIKILEKVVQDDKIKKCFVSTFNDKNPDNVASLQSTINQINGINTLKYKPEVNSVNIDGNIFKQFEKLKLIPTILFIDPWGYKGLSLRLINSVLKDWGCECIFFFNYNRINMGLENDVVKEHMDALFGENRSEKLRDKLKSLDSEQREFTIVEEMTRALMENGGKYVLPFCFKNDTGTRTKQYLIFVTKHFMGYEKMKEIMAKESSLSEQGVPSFQYCPADNRQPLLFELNRPLEDLENMLIEEFEGQELAMEEIYENHSVGKPYMKTNYKEVLKKLKKENKIQTIPDVLKKNTFPDYVKVIFPPKSK